MENDGHLSNREKTLIAMGAAMGAGCRTCADKLHEVARSLDIPADEMREAFRLGLEAKAEAVETMKAKTARLVGDGRPHPVPAFTGKLASLIRMASFVAANSAPDALREAEDELAAEEMRTCISLAKMVRTNAAAFSDQEVTDGTGVSQGQEPCCPLSPGGADTPACSCG